jgi:hypothetical protein
MVPAQVNDFVWSVNCGPGYLGAAKNFSCSLLDLSVCLWAPG